MWSTGSEGAGPGFYRTGSVAVAHRLSCSTVCGIFPSQGSNPCLLHWQADSLPLSHQGSLWASIYLKVLHIIWRFKYHEVNYSAKGRDPNDLLKDKRILREVMRPKAEFFSLEVPESVKCCLEVCVTTNIWL